MKTSRNTNERLENFRNPISMSTFPLNLRPLLAVNFGFLKRSTKNDTEITQNVFECWSNKAVNNLQFSIRSIKLQTVRGERHRNH